MSPRTITAIVCSREQPAKHRLARRLSRPISALTAVGCAGALALCLPASSGASSGGAGIGPPPGQTPQPADLTVSASGDGMTIAALESTQLRTALHVSGSLPSADAGRTVDLQVMGARTRWSWQTAAQTQVRGDGSYSATWQTNRAGQFAVRAVSSQGGAHLATDAGLPTIRVIVYRASIATLYGPGFYGHRTACGEILRRHTIGVANRTLPCGTPVAVYYEGQMMVVPVIDRGPYANGANWDLTMATGAALGIDTTATIGAAALPRSQ